MHDGYVKLWRKSLDSGWLSNPTLWAFWCWCLLKATHKQIKQIVGYQEVLLQPGQFIFGRKKCAKELKTSEQTVRTCLLTLKSNNNLTIKPTNKFSVISIVNWEAYQQDERKNNHQTNHQVNQQLTNNQPTTNHKQECKECKEELIGMPDWLPKEKWDDFKKHRKSIKKPMTAKAEELALSKLLRLRFDGNDPIEVIDNSIINGWSGLFEIKAKRSETNAPYQKILKVPDGNS